MSGPTGNRIDTQMSVGPPKSRRRGSSGVRPFSGRITNLPVAQLSLFETFFREDIAEGTLSFEAEDPLTLETRTWQFVGSYEVRPDKPATVIIEADLRILP